MGRKKKIADQPVGCSVESKARQPRTAALLVVQCDRENGDHLPMRVRNLSETGFGGLCGNAVNFSPDEAVKVVFPHMSAVQASIKWYAGKEVGVQFVKPVDLASIAEARKSAAVPPVAYNPAATVDKFWQDAFEAPLAVRRVVSPTPRQTAKPALPPSLNFGKRRAGS